MKARLVSLALIALVYCSLGANYATKNFVVSAPDAAFARKVGEEAERYRKELAVLWLGQELPDWPQRCPISVRIGMHAGGETSFMFVPNASGQSQPIDWRMKIFGPPERLLDSVLPHEVTHTIFATHYGRPLPRWADEGACTTVEHASEKTKNHKLLLEFLTTNRGIPFNRMFAMKQYPHDILPLYSQGYSLARFLIMQKGHRHFVNFVGEGMKNEVPGRAPQTWNQVTSKYYGYDDLSDLQINWLAWVKRGSPQLQTADNRPASAPASAPASPATSLANVRPLGPPRQNPSLQPPATQSSSSGTLPGESWYLKQSRLGANSSLQKPPETESASETPQPYFPGSIISTRPAPGSSGNKTLWR